jgi:hypothetical protein
VLLQDFEAAAWFIRRSVTDIIPEMQKTQQFRRYHYCILDVWISFRIGYCQPTPSHQSYLSGIASVCGVPHNTQPPSPELINE